MGTLFSTRLRLMGVVFATLCTFALPSASVAQTFPSRPIKLLVGFAPGGSTDAIARLLAPLLAEKLGQPVIVETKSGAAGNLATELLAKSPPDGHTLMVSAGSQIVVSPHAYPNMPVDPVKDLAHIGMICEGEFLVLINPALPASSVDDFVALSKRQPGSMRYGSPGAGGILHVAAELFRLRSGADISAVHYRGTGPILTDLLANQVQMTVASISVAEPYIKSARLRGLVLMAKERSPQLPDLPTSLERGLTDMEQVTLWLGLHAPKGTPAPALNKLREALTGSLQADVLKERMAAAGLTPTFDTPESFNTRIVSDLRLYGEIVRAAKIEGE